VINVSDALTLWVDGKPVQLQESVDLDLKVGIHRVTMSVDLQKLNKKLRVELVDVPGSAARVEIVTGK